MAYKGTSAERNTDMLIRSTTHKIFTDAAAAEALLSQMEIDADDDWSYVVVVDPNGSGRAVIEIRDEDGISLGKL
jgi:hypothetical protein